MGNLDFMWVYLKEQKSEPDMQRPLVIKRGDTIERVCEKFIKMY
jgi:ribosome-interacting GTPase 1